MTGKELLDAGKLAAAIEQVTQDVKAHPAETQLRTFLFELLCFAGDHQRAEKQLEVIAHQSATAEIGVAAYRNILKAEAARSRLFSDGLKPAFLLDPPAYLRLHLDAVNRLRENRSDEAKALVKEATELRPSLTGRLDGQAFLDFGDTDDLLGPVLEAFVEERYAWIPFEQITTLTVEAPKTLRDLLWIPAKLECRSGPGGEVFLPVLYAGSYQHEDDRVRLGRMTDWKPAGDGGLLRGAGQRMFFVDDGERAVLEIRQLEFDMVVGGGTA